jgi:hypothetical protein
MNGHDASWDDRSRELLSSTLDALVEGALPPGAPTAPEHNLTSLRRVVRRWRVVKASAIGGTSLVVAALAAVGVTQLPTWQQADPIPAITETPSPSPTTQTPSPSPSPEPTSSPSPTPSEEPTREPTERSASSHEPEPPADPAAEITAPYVEGHVPNFWSHPSTDHVYCGVPVDELVATGDDLDIAITGEPARTTTEEGLGWQLPVRIDRAVPELEAGVAGSIGHPVAVWAQGGVVVDLHLGWLEPDYDLGDALVADGTWSGVAGYGENTTCVPEEIPGEEYLSEYNTPRAAGTYEVRVIAPYTRETASGDYEGYLAVSDPVIITYP